MAVGRDGRRGFLGVDTWCIICFFCGILCSDFTFKGWTGDFLSDLCSPYPTDRPCPVVKCVSRACSSPAWGQAGDTMFDTCPLRRFSCGGSLPRIGRDEITPLSLKKYCRSVKHSRKYKETGLSLEKSVLRIVRTVLRIVFSKVRIVYFRLRACLKKISLSGETQNNTEYLSTKPKNRRCGCFFWKSTPLASKIHYSCIIKKDW